MGVEVIQVNGGVKAIVEGGVWTEWSWNEFRKSDT